VQQFISSSLIPFIIVTIKRYCYCFLHTYHWWKFYRC